LFAWEVDRTGSGSCPMALLSVSGVEPPASATSVSLVAYDTGCSKSLKIVDM
jgi:hypothetical protein